MTHTNKNVGFRRLSALVLAAGGWLTVPALPAVDARGGRVLTFSAAPDAEAIGTDVGDIHTYVSSVTLAPAADIHRRGLTYLEIRGLVRGVGWGGMPIALRCHYTYELPFVLRVPPAWSGGLVVFTQGAANLPVWEDLEVRLGEVSIGRVFHEQADRHVSDVALHPSRRWAFFAVNTVGVAPGGAHNTLLIGGEPGCAEGVATQAMVDVPTARNHALLARHLLKVLRGREPSLMLGVAHGSGTVVNLLLNAGLEHRRSVSPIPAGDNHKTPYDPSSGRIFDGFLSTQGGFAMGLAPFGQPRRAVSANHLRRGRGRPRHDGHNQSDQPDDAAVGARRPGTGPCLLGSQRADRRRGSHSEPGPERPCPSRERV
jgi:hypothetical protein